MLSTLLLDNERDNNKNLAACMLKAPVFNVVSAGVFILSGGAAGEFLHSCL